MRIDTHVDGRVIVFDGDVPLLDYVYTPTDSPVESPRPYALLATRAGRPVTAYRPDDHVWHKGLSLALPVVGVHNFWGGPTYVHGEGYVQLPNNGAQVHDDFEALSADRIVETLTWRSADGAAVLSERRALGVRLIGQERWALTWRSALRNVSDATLGFGSPTSKGRPDAGYAGIFWRGPAEFTGGRIVGPQGEVGEAARGAASRWLSFVAPDRSATVAMIDADPDAAHPWFARSLDYAGMNPAPFFFHETPLHPGAELTLATALVIGDADAAEDIDDLAGELLTEPGS